MSTFDIRIQRELVCDTFVHNLVGKCRNRVKTMFRKHQRKTENPNVYFAFVPLGKTSNEYTPFDGYQERNLNISGAFELKYLRNVPKLSLIKTGFIKLAYRRKQIFQRTARAFKI